MRTGNGFAGFGFGFEKGLDPGVWREWVRNEESVRRVEIEVEAG